MELDQENTLVGPIIYGSLITVLTILILTTLIGILTNFGWTGTIKWSGNLYLIIVYIAVIAGSTMAGFKSHQKGWKIGAGVGIVSSLICLVFAMLLGEKIIWGVYLIKVLISSFIGTFGGIIGVNFTGRK
jgi:putative membrane protein (TIGR04086 family)